MRDASAPKDTRRSRLFGATHPFTASTFTDENGRFTFKKLAAATYTVAVFQPGRGEARQTIEVGPSLADSRNRIQLTITLKDENFDPTSDRRRHAVTARQLTIPERALRDYADAQRDLEKHDVAAAEKHLEHAVELAPQFAAAWNTLGTIAYQTRPLSACRAALPPGAEAGSDGVRAAGQSGRRAGHPAQAGRRRWKSTYMPR